MVYKVIHILAKNLEAARKHASDTKILNVKSGKWIMSYLPENGKKTYSFKVKKY